MRKTLLLMMPLSVIGALSGCQTWGPTWSEVTGARWYYAELYRRPGVIEHVDDQGAFAQYPVKVEPGMRRIVLGSIAPGRVDGPELKVMMLDVQPCKRYYLNGQFTNNVERTWTPVVDYVDDIPGCTVVAKQ